MTQIDPISLDAANSLLALASTEDVKRWLREHVTDDVFENDSYWRPVGDQLSNAGAIEASPDEINPLVERIVNGMEAVIELKWRHAALGKEPESPRDAIEKLFGIPNGESRVLSSDMAQGHANQVELILRGNRDLPTVVVRDQGIGIHPIDFSETIVAIGQSNKGQKPYLIGMYGQGGSSAFEKSAYTIILSRRHPEHLDGKEDFAGWTVVRRQLATRVHRYSYLVSPTQQRPVPSFPGSIATKIGLQHGTHVAHIDYRDLGPFSAQRITNRAWYTLNYRLFDPLFPWTLREERPEMPRESRTMRGVPYRIEELPQTTGAGLPQGNKPNNTSVRHHISFDYPDEMFGQIKVEWWVLQDEVVDNGRRRASHGQSVDPYRDPQRRYARRRIAITRGGQTHAALTTRIFEIERLRQVARSVVVQVDTDDLSFEAGASFFASNRADLKSDTEAAVERAIRAAIETYRDELRAIERERQNEMVRGRGAADEGAIRDRLDRILREFQRNRLVDATGQNFGPGRGPKDFVGREIPTYLRFASTNVLELRAGIPTHADLLTDAADKTLADPRTRLRVESGTSEITATVVGGGNGRWRVEVQADADAAPSTRGTLTATLESEGVFFVRTESPRPAFVVPPPPPYEGKYPPTRFRLRSQNGTVRIRPGNARVTIDTDATDTLFSDAELSIETPQDIIFNGKGGPRQGEIRLFLDVPDAPSPDPRGTISATLRLRSGVLFSDSAPVIIDAAPGRGGSDDTESAPNYRIVNVRQFPPDDSEVSWLNMAEILDLDSGWAGADAAAYVIGEADADDGSQRQLTFYLNADNSELRNAERRLAQTRSETTIDTFRQQHRTLLCYHLYLMAVNEIERAESDPAFAADVDETPMYARYRQEMIRINNTLLYSQREFQQSPEDGLDGEDE